MLRKHGTWGDVHSTQNVSELISLLTKLPEATRREIKDALSEL
jgi:hypothetical protein